MENREELGRNAYELGLRLGRLGPVAIGAAGGSLAVALARSAGCGVVLAGSEARFHDGSCAACGAWIVKYYHMPASLFVRQEGMEVELLVNDSAGRQLYPPDGSGGAPCTGEWDLLTGADSGWAARRASGVSRSGAVAVKGAAALRLLLERIGYDVLDRKKTGVPLLKTDREGFRLTVELDGTVFCPPGEDALSAAVNWLTEGRAIPAFKAYEI